MKRGGASEPSPGGRFPRSSVAEVGHRRPFFRRHFVVLRCGWDVAAPRGRRRPSGARESPLFWGGAITKIFSKIRKNAMTTTYLLRRKETTHSSAVVGTIGQALRGGHEKCIVGKKFRCQFRSVVPYLFVQALHMPRYKNSSGVCRLKYKKKKALLACLAQRLSAITLRCGTDTAGGGALEPPLEDGARTKLFEFRESHTEAETKPNS